MLKLINRQPTHATFIVEPDAEEHALAPGDAFELVERVPGDLRGLALYLENAAVAAYNGDVWRQADA